MLQTHVQPGILTLDATADLTGKRGYLVKIVNNAGVPNFALPTAVTDICTHIITDDGTVVSAVSTNVQAAPLNGAGQILAKVKGAILPGAQVVIADPATPADAGKIRTLPTTTNGTYAAVGVLAGETAADGDFSLVCPVAVGVVVTVTGN
jgi:hypothetical protein